MHADERTPGQTVASRQDSCQQSSDQFAAYGKVYGFIGNELLTPMNRSKCQVGLDPSFWQSMPCPDNPRGVHGLERLDEYARAAAACAAPDDPYVPGLLDTAVEYTRLFIGPPRPVAPPWETMYIPVGTAHASSEELHIGFGKPTHEMRKLLADSGLEMQGENRQYEDHMGIELLYLSALCERDWDKALWFASAHPLAWIGEMREKVDADSPYGYYSALLEYVHGILEDQVDCRDTREDREDLGRP